ncbi:sensor domain-containing diguanylate cyclase [Thalassotalea sp. G2M2-11]|uniref:GGDEF domain-containing protein n=1 Tax=Thalassotalea sp. G2M2-11 TaxID=2787627 RepID=UPI0019CFA721|nr:sensor domain-containing diguanylate cyclase [Thalassotalea sp. G2M2-11]
MKSIALLIEQSNCLTETYKKTEALLSTVDIELIHCQAGEQLAEFFVEQQAINVEVALIFIGVGLTSTKKIARQLYAFAPKAQLLFWSYNAQYAELLKQLKAPIASIGSHWQILSYEQEQPNIDIKLLLAQVNKRILHQATVNKVNMGLMRNVSVEVSKLQRFTVSLSFLSKMFDAAHDAIVVTTNDGIIVRWNIAAQQLFGLTSEQAIGRKVMDIRKGTWQTVISEMVDNLSKSALEHTTREIDYYDKHHYTAYAEISLSKIEDNHQAIGFLFIIQDITKRKQTELELHTLRMELEQLSFVDPLTGIANRRKFDMVLQKEWSRAIRNSTELSLLMIDVDFFKQFNDNYGHQRGDQCLVQIAKQLKSVSKRGEDLVARYGGEEFAVLLPGIDHQHALTVAEACLASVSQMKIPHLYSKVSQLVSISIGLHTMVPERQQQCNLLIELADQSLYNAKNNGRNRVESSIP